MERVPIGSLLDDLGVTAELEDTDLVASAVIVLAVFKPDSNVPHLCIATNEGLSWIEQAGLLRLAENISSALPDYLGDD